MSAERVSLITKSSTTSTCTNSEKMSVNKIISSVASNSSASATATGMSDNLQQPSAISSPTKDLISGKNSVDFSVPHESTVELGDMSVANFTSPYAPNKRLAVILDSVLNIPLDDYLHAVANKIGAVNIKYASKIGRNRLCIYLNSDTAVQNLVSDQGLEVNGLFIGARRYISSSVRVVLSNVLPDIPTEILVAELTKYGTIASPMLPLHIGTASEVFKHVLSFRRVVYMTIKDDVVVPVSFPVTFDGVTYTVYVTRGDVKCYLCNLTGHVARVCTRSFSKRVTAPPEDFPPLLKDQSVPSPVMTTLKHKSPVRPPLVKTNNLFVPHFANSENIQPTSNPEMSLPLKSGLAADVAARATAGEASAALSPLSPLDGATHAAAPFEVSESSLMNEHLTSVSKPEQHIQDTQQESMDNLSSYSMKRKTSDQIEEDIVPKVLRGNDESSYETVATDEDDGLSQRSYSTTSGEESDSSNTFMTFVPNADKAQTYPISLERFRALLLAVRGKRGAQILSTIQEYTDDYPGLLEMLCDLYSQTDRNGKLRISRLKVFLKKNGLVT